MIGQPDQTDQSPLDNDVIDQSVVEDHGAYQVWRVLKADPGWEARVLHPGDDPDEAELIAAALTQPESSVIELLEARTATGEYIGTPRIAAFLVRRGIAPELIPGNRVCSIGFCDREQKWYGWSHRAIYGFGIGDVVSEGDCTNSSGWTEDYLREHPEKDLSLPVGFKAETLDDAKRMAIAYADSVG